MLIQQKFFILFYIFYIGMPGVLGGLCSIIAAGIYYSDNIKPLNPD